MTDNTKMREAMIDQDGAVWEKIGGAWSLYKPAQSVPVEVFDSRCNYASFAGRVCNKCGRIHDGGKSVAVVGHGMLEKFKLWRDERIGRHALIEPLEWFAGGYARAKSNPEQSVPKANQATQERQP